MIITISTTNPYSYPPKEIHHSYPFGRRIYAFVIDTTRPGIARKTAHTALCLDWEGSTRLGQYVTAPIGGSLQIEAVE